MGKSAIQNLKRTIIFSLLLLFGLNLFLSAKTLELFKEKSFSVKSGQILNVKTDVGDVTIKTWNKSEAHVKIYGDNDAQRYMEFSFDQDERGISIIGKKEGSRIFGWFSNIDLKYEIMVPINFDLDIKTSGGDIVTNYTEGKFNVKTSGGDIYLKSAKGSLDAKTSGGDITLHRFTGGANLATSGGDIEVESENGKVIASTSGGDIFLRSSNGEVDAKTSGGDITLDYSGENMGISLITSGGDIDVIVPSKLNANVDVKTSGGDLTNYFSNNRMAKITKSKIEGKFNNGGSPLICKTSGGDITIKDK